MSKLYEIKFKYKDRYTHGEWREQSCIMSSVAECIRIYGLGKDCEYEILSTKEVSDMSDVKIEYNIPGMEDRICCLCGKKFYGFGNNPWPLAESEYVCCDECNKNKVIPARLARICNNKNKEDK